MLVLSRKPNQNIIIDGRIVVKFLQRDGNSVSIGISSPPDVPVHRQEIYEEIRRINLAAMTTRRHMPRPVTASTSGRGMSMVRPGMDHET